MPTIKTLENLHKSVNAHENLHKNVNENMLFMQIFMHLGSFCSFLNWEGAYIRPQIRLRKIPADTATKFVFVK